MNLIAVCVLSIASLGAGGRGYVLEFSSQQCGPCQQVAPIISKLEREGLPIRTIDVNQDEALASRYGIQTIPAFVLIVDGREVERMTGSQPESRIRQMLARIPASGARTLDGGNLPVNLGQAAPLPRPETLAQAGERSQEQRQSSNPGGERSRLWPFAKPKAKPEPGIVRGKDPDPMPDQSSVSVMPPSPVDASSRLRIITGDSEVKGSGTIIESRPGKTVILTCFHVLRGAKDNTRVEVDLFRNGKPSTYLGTIIGGEEEADVGLISIRTSDDEIYPAIPIAAWDRNPAVGAKVTSIGCGGGETPTTQSLQVTDVNRYKGPDTLICTGIPVQGRSGGGLFDSDGSLVGVCFAADHTGQRGVYCGLRPIYELLNQHQLTHLVPTSPNDTAIAKNDSENTNQDRLGDPAPMPGSSMESVSNPFETPSDRSPETTPVARGATEAYPTDDAEVVVMIRSRTAGGQGDQVIFIHKPSRQFMNYLQGELGDDAKVGSSRSNAEESESQISRAIRPMSSTQNLQMTGLKSTRSLPRLNRVPR